MKIRSYLTIDYKLYFFLIVLVVLLVGIILFSLLLIFNLSTEKNPIIKLIIFDLAFFILFIFFTIRLILRIQLLHELKRNGITVKAKLIKTSSIRKDQLHCILAYDNITSNLDLRVTYKNKEKINNICKEGNEITILFLTNKPGKFIIKDLYGEN